jgi:hypothetical protein
MPQNERDSVVPYYTGTMPAQMIDVGLLGNETLTCKGVERSRKRLIMGSDKRAEAMWTA